MQLYNAADQKKNSGKVATGDRLKIYKSDGSTFRTVEVILYGDTNGDGSISIADLVLTRKHLLELSSLKETYRTAADINRDGKITMADMVFIRKHLLDLEKISQK